MAAWPRPAWLPPPDGSRDPRVEDPTNRWLIHLSGRMMLPLALKARIPANAVSVAGFALGVGAAFAYFGWRDPVLATLGLLLSVGWLILDGLDGMIARATRTTTAIGRFLDGACDHAVFVFLYVALAASIGTPEAWITAVLAGLVHAVQSNFYESERARYHRRVRGDPGAFPQPQSPHWPVRLYDHVAGAMDRFAAPFDQALAGAPDRRQFAAAYADRAAPPLKLLALLTNNVRVILIYAACLAGDPRLFWWIELGPLTAITITGIIWHRRVERQLAVSARPTG